LDQCWLPTQPIRLN